MDKEALSEIIKEVVGDLIEPHFASVHEEISDLRKEVGDLRSEMTDGFDGVRKDMRDGFAGLKSEIGGLHNRIDNETFARKDLEHRIRKVLPNLPEPIQQ